MIYQGINFYEDSIKVMSEDDFVKGHGHHGLSEKQLIEVYSLIVKKNKKKVERVKPEPPSLN